MEIIHIRNLYDATKIRVKHARQLCRLGQKDCGRDILRFVQNASVIHIIKSCDTSKYPGLEMNWSLLEWELSQLEQECHPTSTVDASDDFSKIASSLEIIAKGVQKLLSK
jgi:hypothetical protein